MLRKAAVKGVFYPASPHDSAKFINDNLPDIEKNHALAVMLPHAGWIYSGKTAIRTLAKVVVPDKVILIGPNHTGLGPKISVFPKGSWETPFGDLEIDTETVEKISKLKLCTEDIVAHAREHSLEVIAPFLKYINPKVKITPITVRGLSNNDITDFAMLLSKTVDENTLLIISSDMNHFEDSTISSKKDKAALDAILALDEQKLFETVTKMDISMCGVYPAMVGITFCKEMNCSKTELVEYTNSGHINNNFENVVGYAGVVFYR